MYNRAIGLFTSGCKEDSGNLKTEERDTRCDCVMTTNKFRTENEVNRKKVNSHYCFPSMFALVAQQLICIIYLNN